MKILAFKRLVAADLLDKFERFAGELKDGYQKIKGIECEVHANESDNKAILLSTYDSKDQNFLIRELKKAGFTKISKGRQVEEDGLELFPIIIKG